jgi:hypothetical protein
MASALFTTTYTIQRQSATSDGQGGYTLSYSNAGTTKGRLSRSSAGSDTLTAMQGDTRYSYVFYCPAGVDIKREDQITDGTITVRVLSRATPSAGGHMECLCQEIQEGI